MNKKSFCLLMLASAISASAFASFEGEDPSVQVFNPYGDFLVDADRSCYLTEKSSEGFCTIVEKADKFLNHKTNLGSNSVVIGVWDKQANHWVLNALNKKAKKLHQYPRGLRAINGNPKDIKLRFNEGRVCTVGNNMLMEGSEEMGNYKDTSNTYDYCISYNDETGFKQMHKVDAKTRKTVSQSWD